jgi:flagellar biosynthesis activator protein FlaF
MSYDKYKSAQSNFDAPRQAEYRVFAEVTRSLMQVGESDRKGSDYFEAIDANRRLWLALQLDLSSEENALDVDLRAQLISLAMWVDRYTVDLLKGSGDLEPLVSVNRSIMEGLNTQSTQPES